MDGRLADCPTQHDAKEKKWRCHQSPARKGEQELEVTTSGGVARGVYSYDSYCRVSFLRISCSRWFKKEPKGEPAFWGGEGDGGSPKNGTHIQTIAHWSLNLGGVCLCPGQ